MKQYVCHKRVKAAKIVATVGFSPVDQPEPLTHTKLELDDGQEIYAEIGNGILARYTPVVGDYLVEYEPDGYRSISPAKAFEEGYHELYPETS